MSSQSAEGDQNVLINNAVGSPITVTFGGKTRVVPLEPATIPVPASAQSPARLVRARSGVVPYVARGDLQDELQSWLSSGEPFAGKVVGGRGGSGKTRLAVELCERAEAEGWLCGFLSQIADQEALDALVQAPRPRLVVIDYAELRLEQVELLLPLLAARATAEAPVRGLLLVRASPRHTTDWAERLRNRNDSLDALLDECGVHVLEDLPLDLDERRALFEAAGRAFATRADPPAEAPESPRALEDETFASPLLVVIAAYLAVHGDTDLPASRAALLDELLAHEHRYWRISAPRLFDDDVLPRRVVALATLAGAESEAEATERLRLIPELNDAPAERRALLARWLHQQYPGPRWWNPLEPDLAGEHLVAEAFAELPEVLTGVLETPNPTSVARPLEVYARAAPDHPRLAESLARILSSELERLCKLAVEQATGEVDRALLYGRATTTAAAIEGVLAVVEVEPNALYRALDLMPPGPNLLLAQLAVTLSARCVAFERQRVEAEAAPDEATLAALLNMHGVSLAERGEDREGLAAIEESVEISRRIAKGNPDHEARLAATLNNLSVRLNNLNRVEESLTAIEEAIEIRRELAAADPGTNERSLALALNNLSNRLARNGRSEEGLAPAEDAVEISRRLDDTAVLAGSLHNVAHRWFERERFEESLAAIEEAVELRRTLAASQPAVYEHEFAASLNNLSIFLAKAGRGAESLGPIEEAVAIRRSLVTGGLTVQEGALAQSLGNLYGRLTEAGREKDGIAALEEATEIYRRLDAANPGPYQTLLAASLISLAGGLLRLGRDQEAQQIKDEIANRYPSSDSE